STPTASDICDPNPSLTFNDVTTPGNCPQEYSVTRTWTATDACGNSSTASQTINVTDNTAPVISGVGSNSSVECPAAPSFSSPTASDLCDASPALTHNDVTTPGNCPQEYSVTRTWTATDDCGNSSTASQTINVTDNTAPVISGVGSNSSVECPATPSFSSPTASDLCDPNPTLTYNDVTTQGNCTQQYSVTRTWTATDACGNYSTASQTINVTDNTAPVITCAANGMVACGGTVTFTAPTATDNCTASPVITVLSTTTTANGNGTISHVRTWTVTDACGNTATCSQTLVEQACEGCTPGFWKNHTLIWDQSTDAVSQCVASAAASLGYGGNGTTTELYRVTFGLTAAQMTAKGLPANLTLHQALNLGGGGFKKLARHSVASLLNSCAISFGMTTTGVLTAVHNAFLSGNAEPTAQNFVGLNEQNCPLGGPGTFDPHQPKGNDKNNKVSAYPNPFNSSTTITFKLDVDTNVSLDVYSLNGAKVATLYEGMVVGGQAYNVTFKGETLHEGIYIYKLNTPDQSYFDKLILIK
ncbi:MAG: T9SS type A sorting domain-containing protein, partial [Nitrosopumilus sp.]|nr:T9SS type A sorting domain-containing protein [Nitrosopumilus sp.]